MPWQKTRINLGKPVIKDGGTGASAQTANEFNVEATPEIILILLAALTEPVLAHKRLTGPMVR